MGVTIHYRGTIDDLHRVAEMEDRVLDLVFALGGRATLWRSFADHDASRVVRGLLVDMTPGQDTFSLLFSPEGHLTPLFQIEEAEQAALAEPPYCFVKTQFGSITGHVAIVHLLDALKEQYISNLEVSDEGEYAETRDIDRLKQKKEFLDGAIRSMADGLCKHGLSEEAMEDPGIVASRIERVAMLVQQKLQGDELGSSDDSTQSDDSIQETGETFEASLEAEVSEMDKLRRQNDLRSKHMSRRISEATAAGMSTDEAFRLAMREEGLGAKPTANPMHSDAESVPADMDQSSDLPEPFDPDATQAEEPWQDSLPVNPFDNPAQQADRDRHPAVTQAQALLMSVMDLEVASADGRSFHELACRSAGDILGGAVQATCDESATRIDRTLSITQLKRALSGHAFTRGAVFGMSSSEAIDSTTAQELHDKLDALLELLHNLMSSAWNEDVGW